MKSKATDPWDKLSEMLKVRGNVPAGEGWLTLVQIQSKYKSGNVRMRKILKQLVADGKMEVYYGSQVNSANRISSQVWYRPL